MGGHIWPWEALIFHRCARRVGGRAGRRPDVARIDEKKKNEHPVAKIEHPALIFSSMRATGRGAGGSAPDVARIDEKNKK